MRTLLSSLFTALMLSAHAEAADPVLLSKAKDLTFKDKSWKDCVHAIARNVRAKVFVDTNTTWFAIDKNIESGPGLDLNGYRVTVGVTEIDRDSNRNLARHFIEMRVKFEADAVCRVRFESKVPLAFIDARGRAIKGLPPIELVD